MHCGNSKSTFQSHYFSACPFLSAYSMAAYGEIKGVYLISKKDRWPSPYGFANITICLVLLVDLLFHRKHKQMHINKERCLSLMTIIFKRSTSGYMMSNRARNSRNVSTRRDSDIQFIPRYIQSYETTSENASLLHFIK